MQTSYISPLIALVTIASAAAATDTIGQAAETHLAKGEAALLQNAYPQAIAEFRAGVSGLGELYYDPNSLDDSDQKLALAGIEEKAGHQSVAANLLKNVLAGRLSSYLRRGGP